MIFKINNHGSLLIENDEGNQIFTINEYNFWVKTEFDQYGDEIYYEDYRINEMFNEIRNSR